jgi:hypothetical protein
MPLVRMLQKDGKALSQLSAGERRVFRDVLKMQQLIERNPAALKRSVLEVECITVLVFDFLLACHPVQLLRMSEG